MVGEIVADGSAPTGGKAANIKVLVGYQAYMFVRPVAIQEQLDATRVGRTIRFHNSGNTSVFLDNGQLCPSRNARAEDCAALPSRRIFAGQQWTLPLPGDGSVSYTVESPSGREPREFYSFILRLC